MTGPTTTVVPVTHTTIPLTATLTAPFHHGAGTSGNTSTLRTQDVIQPDGTTARVPFLSAASVRHGLRAALAWHTARTLGWGPVLTKAGVDLLWSGGAVTTTGSQVDLDTARRVDAVFPALGMLGYAAQSDIVAGTLRATDLILACRENSWRIPDGAAPAHTLGIRAAHYRTEEFGTRQDQATSPAAQFIADTDPATTQMIFDTQLLAAGAVLVGSLGLTIGATAGQVLALRAAVGLWAPDGQAHLGARAAQGYGTATITGPDHDECAAAVEAWTAHVTDRGDDILALIQDLTK